MNRNRSFTHTNSESLGKQGFSVFSDKMRQNLLANAPSGLNEMEYPHKLAILNDQGRDLEKRWYIEYYIYNFHTSKLERKREYSNFSRFNTVRTRLAYGNKRVIEINEDLPYRCIGEPTKKQKDVKYKTVWTAIEACEYVLEVKYANLPSSIAHYKSSLKSFTVFLDEMNMKKIQLQNFTKIMAQTFCDYLISNKKLANTTVNNKLDVMHTLFEGVKSRIGILETNPFEGLERPRKIVTKRNFAYELHDIKRIKEKLLEKNPYLWTYCQFIYYTFIRPIEATRLVVGDVNLKDEKIIVDSTKSKNDRLGFVDIPKPLLKIFREMEIDKFPKSYFLFSRTGQPSENQLSKNYMMAKYRSVLDELNYPSEYSLYSWKHTGVVQAYLNGVDMKAIQLQCRHSDIKQTDTYLKSLGFMENTSFKNGIPEI